MSRLTCSQCLRPLPVCYCAQIRRQPNQWPVRIIQDVREARHAIGTARIAALSLTDCSLTPVDPERPVPDTLTDWQTGDPVLIYPDARAQPITALKELTARPLIFIDASWRRSRRILHSMPSLRQLPAYQLSPDAVSRYRIRKQPQASALSTLEAIVSCLQQLESDPCRFDSLLETMDWMIEQQISRMGSDTWLNNYCHEDQQ